MSKSKETGIWLSMVPLEVNGTVLSEVEFRDALCLRDGITPLNLPSKCDGCGGKFTVGHDLGCKKSFPP